MKIGENIKKYRKANKMTQYHLGTIIGKSERSIQKYEHDDVSPPLDVLEQLALALDVEVIDLLYGNDKPYYPIPEYMSKELVINIRLRVTPDGFIDVDLD